MSTAVTKPATSTKPAAPPTTEVIKPIDKPITYVPLGETAEITLSLGMVKKFLCIATKSGKMPTDEQVVKYMMLCKAQSLNPWVNDAYLVGYDGKDGPQFSLITAHQSFLKRAEASPEFDGIESGVIVARGDAITERQGDLLLNGETLVGAWARVHRRDRTVPSYDSLNLSTFNTGRSRWAADPAGMIVKCAEASALRKAFPSTLAAMYCKEEMDRHREATPVTADTRPKTERLTERLLGTTTPVIGTNSDPIIDADGNPDATDLSRVNEVYQGIDRRITDGITSAEADRISTDINTAENDDTLTREEAAELYARLNKVMA